MRKTVTGSRKLAEEPEMLDNIRKSEMRAKLGDCILPLRYVDMHMGFYIPKISFDWLVQRYPVIACERRYDVQKLGFLTERTSPFLLLLRNEEGRLVRCNLRVLDETD